MITPWLAAGAMLASGPHFGVLVVQQQFEIPGSGPVPEAVTYNTEAVPGKSRVTVVEHVGIGGTAVGLRVKGLKPNRTYGAHVHTQPCGAKPLDSGPHYQHKIDPKPQPSGDAAYGNPENEIWLDVRTDDKGKGESLAHVPWSFRPGEARSVVLHDHQTHREPGKAGDAGSRLACVNVPLK